MNAMSNFLEHKRILFTGGGGAGTEALNRLLSDSYEVYFADADIESKPCSISPDRWHQIPFATSPEFIKNLKLLCSSLKIDKLVPGVDEELLQIAVHQAEICCDVLLPSADFVRIHLDKHLSMQSMQEHGLAVPVTRLPAEVDDIGFPCIMKPREGRGSRGVAIVDGLDEMKAHILLSRKPVNEFIAQELLVGQEYTVMVVADKSAKLRAVVPVKVDVKKGITVRAETEKCESVINYCRKLHDCYAEAGVYNVQLIASKSGKIKAFEINPRISTTSCLAYASGVDFLQESARSSNVHDGDLLSFINGVKLRRSWINEFVYP